MLGDTIGAKEGRGVREMDSQRSLTVSECFNYPKIKDEKLMKSKPSLV